MNSYHSGAFPPFFLISYWSKGSFLLFSKMERLRIENENGKRHRPSLGEWKRGGVRAGVREHCLTRGLINMKSHSMVYGRDQILFFPIVLYSESTNPIPYMPEIHIVLGHILPPSRSLLVHYLINYYTRITKIPSFLTFQMRIKTYASIQTHLGISMINNGPKTGVRIRIHGRMSQWERLTDPYGRRMDPFHDENWYNYSDENH